LKISITKELYWTFGTVIIALAFGLLLFNTRLWDGQQIEIQLPNAHLAFSKTFFLTIIFLALLTGCYLTGAIYYRLDNRIAIACLTLLFMVLLTWQVVYLNWVNGYEYHIAPVVDKGDYFEKQYVQGFKEFRGLMCTLILVTGTVLATAGHKLVKRRN
jgi:hypothetical protein